MSDTQNERVTAAMVAKRAGVSVTTVSFALNGQSDRYGIAKETVQRVIDAAREMNFVPNNLARSLRKKSTSVVGVVFPHLRNDWAHMLLEGMYPLFDREGYIPHIVSHRDSQEQEARELESLAEHRVDGILCNPLDGSAASYRRLIDQKIPLVFFGDTLTSLPEVSFAAWDPADVALPVQHLIDSGCRRIVYLGFVDHRRMSLARCEVFKNTVRAAGLELPAEWVILNKAGQSFDASLKKIFTGKNPPDGIFALYTDSAVDAIDSLNGLGLSVPKDVSVATLGESALTGPRAYNVTTAFAPVEEEGRQAAQLLLDKIQHPRKAAVHSLVPAGRLIPRGTTAARGGK